VEVVSKKEERVAAFFFVVSQTSAPTNHSQGRQTLIMFRHFLFAAFLSAIAFIVRTEGDTCLESYEATRLEVLKQAEEAFGWSSCPECLPKSNFCCSDGSCVLTPSECFGHFGAADPDSFRIEQTSTASVALMLTDVPGVDEYIRDQKEKEKEPVMLAAGFMAIGHVLPQGFYGIKVASSHGMDLEASVIDADGNEVAVLRGSRNPSAGPIGFGDWIVYVSGCCICIWDTSSPSPSCNYKVCWC